MRGGAGRRAGTGRCSSAWRCCWRARASGRAGADIAEEDAETGLKHALALHYKSVQLNRELRAAEHGAGRRPERGKFRAAARYSEPDYQRRWHRGVDRRFWFAIRTCDAQLLGRLGAGALLRMSEFRAGIVEPCPFKPRLMRRHIRSDCPRRLPAGHCRRTRWPPRQPKPPKPNSRPKRRRRPTARCSIFRDAAVKKLIKTAKKRGYVTYEEINSVLPSEEVTSEQIEDIMAMFSDMGINVVDEDEVEEADTSATTTTTPAPKSPPPTGTAVATNSNTKAGSDRTDDPVRMYLREMGSVELLEPRGRNRHRQAHRGRPRDDDRGAVRKPADLPGHHHLARPAQRRRNSSARHHRSRSDLCRPRRQAGGARAPRRRGERRPRPRRRAGRGRVRATTTTIQDSLRRARAEPTTTTTTTITRTICRSAPWKPSSSRRSSRPSTASPRSTARCASCRTSTTPMP